MSEEAGKGAARTTSQRVSNPNMIQEGSKGPKQQKGKHGGKRVSRKKQVRVHFSNGSWAEVMKSREEGKRGAGRPSMDKVTRHRIKF